MSVVVSVGKALLDEGAYAEEEGSCVDADCEEEDG